MQPEDSKIIDNLFRTEYGRLVALITGIFGSEHIQLAEDVVQEALIAAIDNWGTNGVPANPSGWLLQVAKRKAINAIKRAKMQPSLLTALTDHAEMDEILLPQDIADSQLRMIFTCCHDALDTQSQIALTLKTLGGFGVNQVATAFLTSESTINKRLYRAKQKIRNSSIPFEIPCGAALERRLDAVTLTMYLLFNEGYKSSSGDEIVNKDLCLEAIRLTKLLVDHFSEEKQIKALLSLMCFHTARFDARVDSLGSIILLEEQDRSLWNQDLIHIGMNYFRSAFPAKKLTSYHIEARISAEHCLAKTFGDTNWECIYEQYTLLNQLKPTPIVKLNLAILISKMQGHAEGLKALDELNKDPRLARYHLLALVRGILLMHEGDLAIAIDLLRQSLRMSKSDKERRFIEGKISECLKVL